MHFSSYKIIMDWGEHRTEGWDIREVNVKVREKITYKGIDVKFKKKIIIRINLNQKIRKLTFFLSYLATLEIHLLYRMYMHI